MGGGNGNPLQNSCLGNPMETGAWRATVHRVAESDTTEQLDSIIILGFKRLPKLFLHEISLYTYEYICVYVYIHLYVMYVTVIDIGGGFCFIFAFIVFKNKKTTIISS